MRLYQSIAVSMLLLSALAACVAGPAAPAQVPVLLLVDGQEQQLGLPTGSSVQQALEQAGVELGPLDRTEPPLYTVLSPGSRVRVVRVTESFEVEQAVIPFETQTLRNESLPVDQEVYLQSGENGLEETTYRRLSEDGVQISNLPVRREVLKEPRPEIVMIGVQAPFAPAALPGRLVYLRDGNVWMMEENTANRQAVVTSGDLDGRIFTLSADRNWLLYTRRAEADEEDTINRLWAVNLNGEGDGPVDLKVTNVIHFADFLPGDSLRVVYSTVEPRATAPGWQANNDLNIITFSDNGWTTRPAAILEANNGGVYGWWGTDFAWAPDGQRLVMARPDGLQLLDYADGLVTPLYDILPLQTRSDWAWLPGASWSPDSSTLFIVDHIAPPGSASPEQSQQFDLAALPLAVGQAIPLASQAGMFAYPLASPFQTRATGELGYEIAYLQADFPNQSESSRYRLGVMDRDGSNRRLLFPQEGRPGLEPQDNWGAWSPEPLPESGNPGIAVIWEGNLWIVDTQSRETFQVTGDGLTSRVAW